jgi:hypothetical protein
MTACGGKAAGEEQGGRAPGKGAGRTGKKITKSFCLALRARHFRLFSHFFLIFFGETEPPNLLFTPHTAGQIDHLSTKSQPVLTGLDPSTVAPEGFEWYR